MNVNSKQMKKMYKNAQKFGKIISDIPDTLENLSFH